MDIEIQNRLEQLRSENCDVITFNNIYGFNLFSDGSIEIRNQFQTWANSFTTKRVVFNQENKKINRWLFELFLQQNRLVTTRQASIQLAMSQSDFVKLINIMKNKNMLPLGGNINMEIGIISEDTYKNLSRYFSSLRFKCWSSCADYIFSLHKVIKDELLLEVQPIYDQACQSSKLIATEYDILTDEPFESHNQVWLDFGKPLALKPDVCSIYTYRANKFELEEYLYSPIDFANYDNIDKKEPNY